MSRQWHLNEPQLGASPVGDALEAAAPYKVERGRLFTLSQDGFPRAGVAGAEVVGQALQLIVLESRERGELSQLVQPSFHL